MLNPELGITPAAADTAADTARRSQTAVKLFRRQNARDQKVARLQTPKPRTPKKPRDVTVPLCRLHADGMRWRPALIAHYNASTQKLPSNSDATRMIGAASRNYGRHKAEFEAMKSSVSTAAAGTIIRSQCCWPVLKIRAVASRAWFRADH